MEIPWRCSHCGSENWIDPENLQQWPLNKIVMVEGFICFACTKRTAFFLVTPTMNSAMEKFARKRIHDPTFRYHFYTTLRKAIGIREKYGQSQHSNEISP